MRSQSVWFFIHRGNGLIRLCVALLGSINGSINVVMSMICRIDVITVYIYVYLAYLVSIGGNGN